MTKRDKDLDSILATLMYDVHPLLKFITKKTYGSEKFNKETLKDALVGLELEDWAFDKYLDKLEKDGLIETDANGFISITNYGENFKIKEGGFVGTAQKEAKESERQNKKDWILNFDKNWRIPAAIILVLGLLVTVVLGILKCSNS